MVSVAERDRELASSSGSEMPEDQSITALVRTTLGTGILLRAAVNSSIEEVQSKRLSNTLTSHLVYMASSSNCLGRPSRREAFPGTSSTWRNQMP